MKHKAEIVIDAGRDAVWKMFDSTENMTRWQPTLKSFTHVSGVPGQPDAVSELVYDENGREIKMIETITARREPEFLGGTYDSDFGSVVIINRFEDLGHGRTRWASHSNHTFKGVMKILALFARRSICRRLDADMNRFKLMVETELAGGPS